MVQTALGHHDQAIEWLNRAYQQRSANMFLINVELKLEPLGDPMCGFAICCSEWASPILPALPAEAHRDGADVRG